MARPQKQGLDYFPLDVDVMRNIKVRRLSRRHGPMAPMVYIGLLCAIYRLGYYMRWDDDTAFMLADDLDMDQSEVEAVVLSCVEYGLFDADMLKNHGILTARSIQSLYQSVSKQARRSSIIAEFSLISSEETGVIAEETGVIAEETPEKTTKSTQIKEKENKIKKNKEKESKREKAPSPSPVFENFVFPDSEQIRAWLNSPEFRPYKPTLAMVHAFKTYYSQRGWTMGDGTQIDDVRLALLQWVQRESRFKGRDGPVVMPSVVDGRSGPVAAGGERASADGPVVLPVADNKPEAAATLKGEKLRKFIDENLQRMASGKNEINF